MIPALPRATVSQIPSPARNDGTISAEEIEAHFNLLPDRYFARTGEADIALHLGMVHRLLHNIARADSLGSLRPVIEWRDDDAKECSHVHIVTWDRAGLFYKLAGALSVAGCNIRAAQIITRADHIAIDRFEVTRPPETAEASARDAFAQFVEQALVDNCDLAPAIAAQAGRISSAAPATVVDVYLEIGSPRVIVEMQAPDRLGLLHQVGRVMAEHGFNLTSARVDTSRDHASDQFHLEPVDGNKADAARLTRLRDALVAVLATP